MSNPPPGPATTPTRSVCVSISACPPRTAELLLRNGLLPEVHRDGCGGPCRRASPSGEHDLAGEGRVAGEQRTTPSSPCAIQLIASRGVSLSAFSCAGPPSPGRTAYGRPAQCTCPPPFAASRPHLRNRGEAIGRSRSTAAAVANEEIVGARSVTKSATGVNRTTPARKNLGRNISFF